MQHWLVVRDSVSDREDSLEENKSHSVTCHLSLVMVGISVLESGLLFSKLCVNDQIALSPTINVTFCQAERLFVLLHRRVLTVCKMIHHWIACCQFCSKILHS